MVAIGVQLLALVGMVAVSVWGWKHLAPDTRIRRRGGTTGIDWTMGKNTTLLLTPLFGLFILLGTVGMLDSSSGELVAWLGVVVMVIFLAAHWSTVRREALAGSSLSGD